MTTPDLPHDAPAARLARIAEVHRLALTAPGCPADLAADLAWHAQATESIIAGADPRRAFGLHRAPGPGPETIARKRQRDALLREAHAAHFGNLSLDAAAKALLALAKRCERRSTPVKAGSPEAAIIAAAKLAALPTTSRRLRTILKSS